jgi:hypothetical protein
MASGWILMTAKIPCILVGACTIDFSTGKCFSSTVLAEAFAA